MALRVGSNRPISPSCFLDGDAVPVGRCSVASSAGAGLLGHFAKQVVLPEADALPYLFCGNGSCRDCALLVEGLADIASCRIPLTAGLSMRSGEGAGDENVLSRKIGRARRGEPLSCDVVVVGAGRSGRAAASSHRALGKTVEILEARSDRADPPRPGAVWEGALVALEAGIARPVEAATIVLATGARDELPNFPGAFLPGVFPMDLCERYASLGFPVGRSVLLAGSGDRAAKLERALLDLGVERVVVTEGVRSVFGERRVEGAIATDSVRHVVDAVAVSGARVPCLELAKALGCRTRYDRGRGCDVLEIDRGGVPGIVAVGSMAVA